MDDFDFEGASYTLSRGDQEWSEEVARRRQDNHERVRQHRCGTGRRSVSRSAVDLRR